MKKENRLKAGKLNKSGVILGGEEITVYDVDRIARAVIEIVQYKGLWYFGVNVNWRGPDTGGYGFAPSLKDSCQSRSEAIRKAKNEIKHYVVNVIDRSQNKSTQIYLMPMVVACEQRSLFD